MNTLGNYPSEVLFHMKMKPQIMLTIEQYISDDHFNITYPSGLSLYMYRLFQTNQSGNGQGDIGDTQFLIRKGFDMVVH